MLSLLKLGLSESLEKNTHLALFYVGEKAYSLDPKVIYITEI